MDLSISYLGLKLKNPLIVGASNLTLDLKKALELQKAGAAAIVFKSLFEEQLNLEAAELDDDLHAYDDRNAEMINLFPKVEHAGPKAHLLALRELKETLDIPVIASLNCLYKESWEDYARHLAETGVDALELNFYAALSDGNQDPAAIESEQVEVLKRVLKKVNIPVAVKLSPYYTNPLSFISRLDGAGAAGFVLFNRLFQPDINVETEALEMPYNLSQAGDSRLSLRYMGLLHGKLNGSLCANTGILEGKDLIAALLAGADAVQVVSAVYRKGFKGLAAMLEELTSWMSQKGYKSVDAFRGKLSSTSLKDDPYAYKRAQYVDFLMKSKTYTDKYPVN